MKAVIKINPSRLPKPLLPPTKPVRIDTDIPTHHSDGPKWKYQTNEERKKKACMNRKTRVDAWTPEQDETIWKMYYEKKMTLEQIGEEMGRTRLAIHSRLQRLRKRKEFADHDGKENEKAE